MKFCNEIIEREKIAANAKPSVIEALRADREAKKRNPPTRNANRKNEPEL
jgi:hypothetical protein